MIGRFSAALGLDRGDVSLGLSAAVLVLAFASRGDAIVVAVLLVAASARPVALGAVLPALVASSWRWGTTSLEALAGNQAVLGPAGWVGPRAAATGSWLAAAALVLALPRGTARRGLVDLRRPRALVEIGLAGVLAADVVAGPGPGGDLLVRVLASAVLVAVAFGVATARRRRRWLSVAVDVLAVGAGVGALVAVGSGAPAWTGSVAGPSVRESVAVTAAVLALLGVTAVAQRTRPGARWSLGSRPL